MHSFTFSLLAFAGCALAIPLIEPLGVNTKDNQTAATLRRRETLEPLKGSDFEDNGGLYAAKVAVPYFLFAKDGSWSPCYPESAVELQDDGRDKNKGTDSEDFGPAGLDPGDDCMYPGPNDGPYSPGKPFPVYYTPKYCDNHQQWRMTYSLYYVHDGVMSEGHRHDWESVTVAWTSNGNDLWDRNALILSQHSGYTVHGWGDIISVDGTSDTEEIGLYESHPKVYVGFFKHANFPDKDTSLATMDALDYDHEYRSDDWAYWPNEGDLHPGTEIGDWNAEGGIWDYGHANSDPWNIDGGTNGATDICAFGD